MCDRAAAYAMRALLTALFWVVGLGLVLRATWSQVDPADARYGRYGRETFNNSWRDDAPVSDNGDSRSLTLERERQDVTDQPTCEWMCSRSGLYAQWAARDVPCVCSVIP